MTRRARFLGKFRGEVIDVADPLRIGRIQASVPDLPAPHVSGWALPCFPVTGMFMVPRIGATVWIEFEKGDRDYPIWTGCFYSNETDLPVLDDAQASDGSAVTIETPGRNGLVISDLPGADGGITLRSASGATVSVNEAGIHIINGQGASLTLTGPSVTINNGALSID